MEHSNECSQIFTALSAAQGEIKQPVLDCKVDFTTKEGRKIKYDYATLGEVLRCIKEPNLKHGIFVTQDEEFIDGSFYLVTLLTHSSGEWIKYRSPLIGNFQSDPKIFGGAKTYMRRYALYGIYNLYGQEDSDAQEIEGEEEKKPEPKATDNQLVTIERLLSQTEVDQATVIEYVNTKAKDPIENLGEMNSSQASSVIKKLIETKKNSTKGDKECDKIQTIG